MWDGYGHVMLPGCNLLGGRIRSTLVEEVRLVRELVGYNLVRIVIADGYEVGGFVWHEFIREKIGAVRVVCNDDAVLGIRLDLKDPLRRHEG